MYNFPRKLNLLPSFRPILPLPIYWARNFIIFHFTRGNFCALARLVRYLCAKLGHRGCFRPLRTIPHACVLENVLADWNVIGSHPILDSAFHPRHRNFRYQFYLCRFQNESLSNIFLCAVIFCDIVLFASKRRVYSQLILKQRRCRIFKLKVLSCMHT